MMALSSVGGLSTWCIAVKGAYGKMMHSTMQCSTYIMRMIHGGLAQ